MNPSPRESGRASYFQSEAGIAAFRGLDNAMRNSRKLTIIAIAACISLGGFGCALSPEAKESRAVANGKRFLEKQDYPRAVLQFRNAVAAMPKNAENYYQLGLAFVGNRDLQSAFNSFRKTLELDPKHARAQMELSRIMATTDRKSTRLNSSHANISYA